SGLAAGLNAARLLRGQEPIAFPQATMIGALCWYVTHAEPKLFQPKKANFGLMPPLDEPPRGKRGRATLYAERAMKELESFILLNRDPLKRAGDAKGAKEKFTKHCQRISGTN
ncbi:MAG: hypothetical protein AAB427_10085, partial [Chloroflexota bacterium]